MKCINVYISGYTDHDILDNVLDVCCENKDFDKNDVFLVFRVTRTSFL